MFAAKYQLKRVNVAILNCASFHSLCCLVNRKCKSLNKQCFYRNNELFCGIKSCNACSNAVFRRWHSPTIVLLLVFIALPMIRCSKLAQKSAVQVRQVDTVFMETTQLVLIRFENFLAWSMENWIRYLCAAIFSECCELMKLCDINCSGPVFWDTVYTVLHCELKWRHYIIQCVVYYFAK